MFTINVDWNISETEIFENMTPEELDTYTALVNRGWGAAEFLGLPTIINLPASVPNEINSINAYLLQEYGYGITDYTVIE